MKLRVFAKCDDRCQVSVMGTELTSQGYVPRNIGIGGGDYISLTIDTETGKIEGWQPLDNETLASSLERA